MKYEISTYCVKTESGRMKFYPTLFYRNSIFWTKIADYYDLRHAVNALFTHLDALNKQ